MHAFMAEAAYHCELLQMSRPVLGLHTISETWIVEGSHVKAFACSVLPHEYIQVTSFLHIAITLVPWGAVLARACQCHPSRIRRIED